MTGVLPDEPDPRRVRSLFEVQFLACERLLGFAWKNRPRNPNASGFELIKAATYARGTVTFRAVLKLCSFGYIDSAEMLNRSLFEDMVVAHWLWVRPEEAVSLFEKHAAYVCAVRQEKIAAHAQVDYPPCVVHAPLSETDRKELERLFGKQAQGHWTGKTVYALIKDIEQTWPEGPTRDGLKIRFEISYRFYNRRLHHSPDALLAHAGHNGVEPALLCGPSNRSPIEALGGAFQNYADLISLHIQEAHLDRVEELEVLHWEEGPHLNWLPREIERQASRNDPCPCGSGRKYKNCHYNSRR